MSAADAIACPERRFFGPPDAPTIPEMLAALPVEVSPDVHRSEQVALLDTADRWFARAGACLQLTSAGGIITLRVTPRRPEAEVLGREGAWEERLGFAQPKLPGPCPGRGLGARLRYLLGETPVRVIAGAELETQVHRLVRDGDRLMARRTIVQVPPPGSDRGFCEVVLRALSPEKGPLEAVAVPFQDDERFVPAERSPGDELLFRSGAAVPEPQEGEELVLQPGDRFVDAAYRVLRRHFGRMLRNEPGTRLGLDPEYLHDMRVATRRLREALRVFRDALPARRVQALRRHLRWVADALGAVRDLDVHLGTLDDEARLLPTDLRGAMEFYADTLMAHRQRARRQMLRVLATRRYEGFVESFRRFLSKGPPRRPSAPAAGEPVTEAARSAIRKRLKRVRKDGRAVAPDSPDEQLHSLRIRCKRLRYACEFFADLYGAPAEEMARRAKRLQDVLGTHQDAVVATGALAALAEEVRGPRDESRSVLMALGFLMARQVDKARNARRRFAKRWRKFDRKKVRRPLRAKLDKVAAEL